MEMDRISFLRWGILFGHCLELMEAILMVVDVVRGMGVLRYVLLVVSQMGGVLVILGEI